MIPTQPIRGTADHGFMSSELRYEALRIIRGIFVGHGFRVIETPALESLQALQAKAGSNQHLIFPIQGRGEDPTPKEGLRYDHTVSLARYMSKHFQDLSPLARVFQIGPVWRAERPGKARLREFTQCDVDILGPDNSSTDLDILNVLHEAIRALGIDAEIHINHRESIFRILEDAGISHECRVSICTTLDKWDTLSSDGILQELQRTNGLSFSQASDLVDRILAAQTPNELEEHLQSNLPLQYKPTLIRGLDYYTGMIFEIVSPHLSKSIGGGGRYGGLIPLFKGGQAIPSVGGALGLERLLMSLPEIPIPSRTHIIVFVGCDDEIPRLRTLPHVIVEGWYGSIKKGLKYGSRFVPEHSTYALFKAGCASILKNLNTGEQVPYDFEAFRRTVSKLSCP